MVLNQRQLGAEGLRTGHNVFNGLQFGHVKPRFCRHVQLFVAGSQAGFLVFRNRASHASFAPVVGGQRQMPVAKHAVQFLQVIECGAGRGQHVAAVIPKDVLLELKVFSGGGHELPHAGRFGTGNGLRVEGAFNEGQQRQFGRHLPALQLFNNMKQVFARTLGHALDIVRAAGIPLLAVSDQLVLQVGHGKAPANTIP